MASAVDRMKHWKRDPLAFVREVFGCEPDAWQAEGLRAFNENKKIAMKACKGPGKTTLLAWICWLFLLTRYKPNIAAVSVTADNLRDGLWKEMAKWQGKSELLQAWFTMTRTKIENKEHPLDWWMAARSFPKQGNANEQAGALAGLHSDYMLFVMDEAGDIPDAVAATAEASMSTGIETKMVIAGNPTRLEGPLYNAVHRDRKHWYVVEITGDPDDPNRSPRISVDWAREQIEKYGKENPWVLVNVFGKFPPASLNTLLGIDDVSRAVGRRVDVDSVERSQKRIGVDVARFGDDRSVIVCRQGLLCSRVDDYRNLRSNELAAIVCKLASEFDCQNIWIDDSGGYGGGVIDSLIQSGMAPNPVAFSGKALDSRYFNTRSEMWFLMAEWVKRGGCLPHHPDFPRELTAAQYNFQAGKFRIEAKDQIKSRLGYSPDMVDALALTFAIPDMSVDKPLIYIPGQNQSRMRYEYDPISDERMNK